MQECPGAVLLSDPHSVAQVLPHTLSIFIRIDEQCQVWTRHMWVQIIQVLAVPVSENSGE
jgi:hypothetical protein